ncbi:MAG TPA: hypothetical protein VFR37_08940 [Longimicrobium sp.]|nr:hypothetical protein [Longimicrobium sp.]
MSPGLIHGIGERARRTAAELAWAQWSVMAPGTAAAERRPRSIVDPEALVLLSLAMREADARLNDVVLGWARRGAALLSVQRMTTLAEGFPGPVRDALGDFAAAAGERRWRAHAGAAQADDRPLPGEAPLVPLRLTVGPALMLRLRAGFGVGAKADLLALLLGLRGAPAAVSLMAAATGYSGRALRTAAEEMALAGFIERQESTPVAYRADYTAWAGVLRLFRLSAAQMTDVPKWRYWAAVFAFLAEVDCWATEAEEQGWSPYRASSSARDLVQDHARPLQLAGLRLPDPATPGGAAFLEDLAAGMDRVHAGCLKNL